MRYKMTCPFTGVSFPIIEQDGFIIAVNPLDDSTMKMMINDNKLIVPLDAFNFRETLTLGQAADLLGVSRQRISQIAHTGVIPVKMVADEQRFLTSDVLRYKRERKVGRPRKEADDGTRPDQHDR